MRSFTLLKLSIFSAALAWLGQSFVQADKPASKEVTVPKILEVTYELRKTKPPTLVLNVVGQVPTGGYTEVRLERATYDKPPKDGIQDYYLKAVPPSGIATTALSEVKASDVWSEIPFWVKGVRVHGEEQGIKVIRFDQSNGMEPVLRRFTGTADGPPLGGGTYEAALQQAVRNLNLALGEGGVRDATATWKVVKTSGQVGGIGGLNRMTVVISAERQPPWPKKQSASEKRSIKPLKTK